MDWKLVIADLADCGYTQPQIAAACGCAQSTISDLASGKTERPRFDLGASLIALRKKAKAAKVRAEKAKAL